MDRMGRRAQGAGHRAQCTGLRAQGAGRRAQGEGRRAQGAGQWKSVFCFLSMPIIFHSFLPSA